jgi:hypothetical protein
MASDLSAGRPNSQGCLKEGQLRTDTSIVRDRQSQPVVRINPWIAVVAVGVLVCFEALLILAAVHVEERLYPRTATEITAFIFGIVVAFVVFVATRASSLDETILHRESVLLVTLFLGFGVAVGLGVNPHGGPSADPATFPTGLQCFAVGSLFTLVLLLNGLLVYTRAPVLIRQRSV